MRSNVVFQELHFKSDLHIFDSENRPQLIGIEVLKIASDALNRGFTFVVSIGCS